MAAVCHIGVVVRVFGPSSKSVWRCCAKCSWNRWRSFDNVQVFILCELGSKSPIHAPFGWFWGFAR